MKTSVNRVVKTDMSNICTGTELIDRADVGPTVSNEEFNLSNSLGCRVNHLHTDFAMIQEICNCN